MTDQSDAKLGLVGTDHSDAKLGLVGTDQSDAKPSLVGMGGCFRIATAKKMSLYLLLYVS